MTEIEINFDKRFEGGVPAEATYGGIYVVYAFNGDRENPVWNLLDIGQGNNIFFRHLNHERKSKWDKFAKDNQRSLIIYTCELNNANNHRDIAEAALLFKFQPMFATAGKDGYHHGDAVITVTGHLQNAFGQFVVQNTDY